MSVYDWENAQITLIQREAKQILATSKLVLSIPLTVAHEVDGYSGIKAVSSDAWKCNTAEQTCICCDPQSRSPELARLNAGSDTAVTSSLLEGLGGASSTLEICTQMHICICNASGSSTQRDNTAVAGVIWDANDIG